MARSPGLYEALVTRTDAQQLTTESSTAQIEPLQPDPAPHILARHIHDAALKALRSIRGKKALATQVELTNQLLRGIAEAGHKTGVDQGDEVSDPARMLMALTPPDEQRLGQGDARRPKTPLRSSDLLVNGPRDLRVGPEIQRELASADRVDVLLSFLKWSGFRLMRDALAELCRRRPGGLRVLTTTYMGATDIEAVQAIRELGGDVRISYDARRTRLHAKAWMFSRDSGFSTAVVGSSNLSVAAMLDGCEWNVRLSSVDNALILRKFQATFAQYWDDPSFEPYDRDRFRSACVRTDAQRDHLARIVQLQPHPHQVAALQALELERARGHNRNLVVAATGTGKTVVAALDYARLRKQRGRATLLFVAHRKEILEQSLAVYRVAVSDGNFGEVLAGPDKPLMGTHVFATIQSLSEARLEALAPDAYDIVVVDEAHHAPAKSYQRMLAHLRPAIMLGLTATPERTDGRSLLPDFGNRIATELRLWDALDQQLLVPFQYFGVHDGVDLSQLDFRGGRYDLAALEKVYTADDRRADLVLRSVLQRVRAPRQMTALGFCVSIKHARYMAEVFTRKQLPSQVLTGSSSGAERRAAVEQLRAGEICCLFTVDLFNEGIDIPQVDTVLLLRPTQSPTIFLQQLGRGLRLHGDKSCLTVLDFIGQAHRRFRFDLRYRAITGGTRAQLRNAIEQGFPFLPSGCSIELEATAQRVVLDNVRESLGQRWSALGEDLRALGDVSLERFLQGAQVTLEELYSAPGRSFQRVRREAGFSSALDDSDVTRGVARLLHVDDSGRLQTWARWIGAPSPPSPKDNPPLQAMFFAALGRAQRPLSDIPGLWATIWGHPPLRQELGALLAILDDRRRRATIPIEGMPFHVHATYGRDEIAAGLQQIRKGKLLRTQGGVYSIPERQCDILYVTLDKDAKDFSPTTLYNDYLLSPSRFHWESQGNTPADGSTGRRYREHVDRGWRILLFVRRSKKKERGGITPPYLFLGPVRYESHQGSKPMQVIWRLERPAPADWYREVKIAAG